MSTAQTFTLPKLKLVIRETIREELRELLVDPDFGLAIRSSVNGRLAQSQKSKQAGRVISAQDLIHRLDLRV